MEGDGRPGEDDMVKHGFDKGVLLWRTSGSGEEDNRTGLTAAIVAARQAEGNRVTFVSLFSRIPISLPQTSTDIDRLSGQSGGTRNHVTTLGYCSELSCLRSTSS